MAPGAADEDGWLHTGDLGRIDEEGFLYVEDRLGDVIVTGGENVLPAEVEEVLLRHPGVADAAVVGRADAEWQEAVTAVVVLRDGAEVERRRAARHCAAELAGFKVPKRVEFVAELPRTASGKLRAQGAAVAIDGGADRKSDVARWLDDYVEAWKSYDRERDRGAVRRRRASYRYHPYDEPIRGREAIVESWLDDDPTSPGQLRRRLRAGRGRRRRRRRDRRPAPTPRPGRLDRARSTTTAS